MNLSPHLKSLKNMVFLGLAMVLGFAEAGPAVAAENRGGSDAITWLWSPTSAAVSQSTAALAIGRPQRALWLAQGALDGLAGRDRALALHNICIGRHVLGDARRAEPSCTAAAVAFEAMPGERDAALSNIAQARRTAATARGLRVARHLSTK